MNTAFPDKKYNLWLCPLRGFEQITNNNYSIKKLHLWNNTLVFFRTTVWLQHKQFESNVIFGTIKNPKSVELSWTQLIVFAKYN